MNLIASCHIISDFHFLLLQVLESVFKELKAGGLMIVAVKVVLSLQHQPLYPAAIEQLQVQTEVRVVEKRDVARCLTHCLLEEVAVVLKVLFSTQNSGSGTRCEINQVNAH